MKNKKLILLLIPLTLTLILSSFQIYSYVAEGYTNKKIMKDLKITYSSLDLNSSQASELSTIDIAKADISNRKEVFNKLKSTNSDVIAWIYINDTKIDYPIVQSENNEDYLNKTLDNTTSKYGSIFMDYRNDIDNLDTINGENLVIYGHNMKDKQMFGSLDKFTDKNFFNSNPIIALLLGDEEYYFQVISTYITSNDDNYINTSFSSTDEFSNFIDKIENKSKFITYNDSNSSNLLLTLSTCSYEFKDARLVVHCSLIE